MSSSSHLALAIGERDGHRGEIIDRVNGYDIINCHACGFRHVLQLPSADELKAAYSESYYRDEKPTYVARAQEDAEWQTLAWQDRLSLFEDLLERDPTRPFSVLDIGCGPAWRDGSMPCTFQPRVCAVFRNQPGPQPMSSTLTGRVGSRSSRSSNSDRRSCHASVCHSASSCARVT